MDAFEEPPENPVLSLAERTSFQLSAPGDRTIQLMVTEPLAAVSVQGKVVGTPGLVTTTSAQSEEENSHNEVTGELFR